MHILVTRPEREAASFGTQLEALGHAVAIDPLLRIEQLPLPPDALEGVAGLITTSRNGVQALAKSPLFARARKLPLLAVGPGTAQRAIDLGFANVISGSGTAANLVPTIIAIAGSLGGALLHVRGEEVAFDLKTPLSAEGIEPREIVGYRSIEATRLRPRTRDLLANGSIDAVILMSPRTGSIFARLIAAEGLEKAAHRLVLLCISPAVAATVEPLGPRRVEVADSPNSAAMLAAVTRVATLWSGV